MTLEPWVSGHLWRGLGAICAPQHSSALSSVSRVDRQRVTDITRVCT